MNHRSWRKLCKPCLPFAVAPNDCYIGIVTYIAPIVADRVSESRSILTGWLDSGKENCIHRETGMTMSNDPRRHRRSEVHYVMAAMVYIMRDSLGELPHGEVPKAG